MEPEKYLLWNTRGQGWFTTSSTTSTDRRDARIVFYEDAIELAKLHRRGQGLGLIPVSITLLKELES